MLNMGDAGCWLNRWDVGRIRIDDPRVRRSLDRGACRSRASVSTAEPVDGGGAILADADWT